ncbi:MAG TPA: hypothetical protein VIV40_10780 [Kofleriaceae bacterium]
MKRLGVVIFLAAIAVHAFADSTASKRAEDEAKTRVANNDFVGAAAKYREAFRAEPRPELMCNVGVAYYKAKDLPRAQRYLDQCLSIGTSLERTFITQLKNALAAVDSALSKGDFTPVDLLVQPPNATTTVDGGTVFDEPILGSRRVWFPFGKYRLTVHAEGHVDRVVEIDAKDRTQVPVRVALEDAPVQTDVGAGSGSGSAGSAQGSAQGSADTGAGSGSAVVVVPPPPPPPVAHRSVLAPVIATGASIALGGVALGFFLAARSSANQAGDATDQTRYDELKQQAFDRQHMSWLFGGIAGAGAIVSGVLWYRYASAPHVEVQASGSGGGVAISGRW